MNQAREHYEQEALYARLKADNARLREAVEAALDAFAGLQFNDREDSAMEKLRAALKVTP